MRTYNIEINETDSLYIYIEKSSPFGEPVTIHQFNGTELIENKHYLAHGYCHHEILCNEVAKLHLHKEEENIDYLVTEQTGTTCTCEN